MHLARALELLQGCCHDAAYQGRRRDSRLAIATHHACHNGVSPRFRSIINMERSMPRHPRKSLETDTQTHTHSHRGREREKGERGKTCDKSRRIITYPNISIFKFIFVCPRKFRKEKSEGGESITHRLHPLHRAILLLLS